MSFQRCDFNLIYGLKVLLVVPGWLDEVCCHLSDSLSVGPDPAQVQGGVALQPAAGVLPDSLHVQGEVGGDRVQDTDVVCRHCPRIISTVTGSLHRK